MGFLHKLWDETLAGPAPETGLGKLRKYNSFVVRPPVVTEDDVPISRSITIVRTHSNFTTTATSNPTSPPRSRKYSNIYCPFFTSYIHTHIYIYIYIILLYIKTYT
ncbi:putative dormancy/auxin associated protein [Lupinus albus]|uniref:Putative dormancy/auxin associated protein n=1 Tax=Lupinus albus TaxID=3870 RepID=A0A6A4PWD6_LUPAL|nr:putative dormancy/auxin associated protein [Lupinus albus]